MRLFRRRNEDAAPAAHDADSVSRMERETLDDSNYQTVKAVPAVVVVNSPKVHKSKGQLRFYFPSLPILSNPFTQLSASHSL